MARPTTKEDLLISAKENYGKLNELISKLSEKELNTPFDFSADVKKKEAHWKRDKNLRDILMIFSLSIKNFIFTSVLKER